MNANTYIVTGNTYTHREFLKREYHARWDAERRAWTFSGRILESTLYQMRRMGLRVAVERAA